MATTTSRSVYHCPTQPRTACETNPIEANVGGRKAAFSRDKSGFRPRFISPPPTKRTQRAAAAILACLGILLLAPPTFAAIPGAENKKGYTNHDYVKALLSFNRRTLGEAYQENGHKNPLWDAAVMKFLDAMAVRFTNAASDGWCYVPGYKSEDELIKLADAATSNGCDDPLVMYCRAVLLDDHLKRSPAEVGPIVQAAAEEMATGKYPITRALAAQNRMHRLTDRKEQARRDEVWKGVQEMAVNAVAHWRYRDIDQRIIFKYVWEEVFNDASAASRTAFVDAVMVYEKSMDPWVMHMIAGQHERKLAWEGRGGGYADTVTEQGWQTFNAHLDKAREHFTAAQKLKPEFPEAAHAMMDIAMGSSSAEPGDTVRDWFDKAVTAQLDFAPAYSTMLWSLRPRWGGTHEKMYAFGVECLESGRFDTLVPMQFVNACNDVADDAGANAVWERPKTYEYVKRVYEGLLPNVQSPPGDLDLWRSQYAAMVWRTGNYAATRRLLDELGDHFKENAFTRIGAMGRLTASQAYAMREDLAPRVSAAEDKAVTGDLAGAAADYEQMLKSLPAGDRAEYFLRSRQLQFTWQRQFEAGEWVDIQPDKQLHGWQPIYGTWTVADDGALVAQADKTGLWMPLQARFLTNNRFEAEMDVEITGAGDPSAMGIAFEPVNSQAFYGVFARRFNGQGRLVRYVTPNATDIVEIQPTNKYRIVADGKTISADWNGKTIFSDHPVQGLFSRTQRYVGLGNGWKIPGEPVRIRNLRVRVVRDGN